MPAKLMRVIKAALDALEADPKANDMAKGLLSDANDSASSALLTYETAAQASASAQGSYSNALAQSEVANAGAEEFAKKRALADGAAINEALEAVLGAKNATAAAKAEALDAAADAFVNAQTAVTAAKTAVAQAYAFERAKAIEGDATEEIIAGVEACEGERDAPPTDLSAVPGFIMPLYDLQQSVIAGSIKIDAKVGGNTSITAADISSSLSSIVSKTAAAIGTTSQVASVILTVMLKLMMSIVLE